MMKDVVLFGRGKKEKNNNLGLWWHGRASTGTGRAKLAGIFSWFFS